MDKLSNCKFNNCVVYIDRDNYLDKIVYGNANQEQLPYLVDSRWNGFVRHVSKNPFPTNSSLETESEIKELIK